MTTSIQVLLVDDHAVVREGYRRLLESDAEIAVCAEAGTGEAAYQLFCTRHFDVIVMDLTLPGVGGIEIMRRMLAREPQARVLIFSMHEDVVFPSRALEAGAQGYLTKSSAPDILIEAVRAVAAGKIYISAEITAALQQARQHSSRNPLSQLTDREFEVFRLLVAGHTLAEMSSLLNLSQKTIANYRSNIHEKLAVDNPIHLLRIARANGVGGG